MGCNRRVGQWGQPRPATSSNSGGDEEEEEEEEWEETMRSRQPAIAPCQDTPLVRLRNMVICRAFAEKHRPSNVFA